MVSQKQHQKRKPLDFSRGFRRYAGIVMWMMSKNSWSFLDICVTPYPPVLRMDGSTSSNTQLSKGSHLGRLHLAISAFRLSCWTNSFLSYFYLTASEKTHGLKPVGWKRANLIETNTWDKHTVMLSIDFGLVLRNERWFDRSFATTHIGQ